MKNKFHYKKIGLVTLLLSLLAINSCTKKFEQYNTDSNSVSNAQLIPDNNLIGGFYPMLEHAIVPSHINFSLLGMLGEYHINGPFAGYMTECYPEESPGGNYNFSSWSTYELWGLGYNSVMAPVLHLQKVGTPTLAPDFWAIALILQVAEMHKITDIYGPIPFFKYGIGGTTVPYDSQESIYHALFAELDTAINNLKTYLGTYPGATPFAKYDLVYQGNYNKWLKYANSLRLRLAMHIVKIDPALAKQQALKALDPTFGGVFTSNDDNAVIKGGFNSCYYGFEESSTLRAGGAIISYLNGYNDPRLPKYFSQSSKTPQYLGLKTGSIINSYGDAFYWFSGLSKDWSETTPCVMMNVSEVNFLLAEGALRGWNMGGPPQSFYEAGIESSLGQWGVVGGAITTYINDATSKCQDFIDSLEPLNNSPALSSITIKWDDAATNEKKLERIITQKWIALFPDGAEGWTNFRRTGYPKLFPITASQNHSGGTISTTIQIRREPYPLLEYTNNAAEVTKGITLLGGPDNGGTRVWWDVNGPNF